MTYIKGSKELRKERYSSGDVPYFLTLCSYDKKIIFREKEFEAVCKSFNWLETNNFIKIFCYILMPDHLHAVFQLIGDKNLSEVVSNLKISVWKFLKEKIGSDKFWQQGFFDHRIKQNERFMQIIYYCHNNPYKAGIIDTKKHYPFWFCESGIQEELYKRLDFFRYEESCGKGFNPRKRKDYRY